MEKKQPSSYIRIENMKGMKNEIPLCMKAIGTFRNGVDIPEGENNKNDRKVRNKKSIMRSESIAQQD